MLLKEPSPRIWADDRDTGTRRNPTSEEEHAFWAWAIIELLRHSGIQVEELTELHLGPHARTWEIRQMRSGAAQS
jgi:hypothetical protein